MEDRLIKLIAKRFLTKKELYEITLMENITFENNGYSGYYFGYYKYTIYADNEEYDVYSKVNII